MFESFIYPILLGIVQGISEFLPISSSGHLVILSFFVSGETLPLHINIALHIGTLAAVLIYFWKDWLRLLIGLKEDVVNKKRSFESRVLIPGLILGSVPAGVIGILWQDQIEEVFHKPGLVAWPLMIVGFLIWLADVKSPTKKVIQEITLKDTIIIGVFQAIALIPGVSRSGITILGGRLLGIQRDEAAKFCFLLGTPAMLGAALLNGSKILDSFGQDGFFVGCLSAVVVGCLSIKFLLAYLRKFGFLAFAIYRLIVGIVILVFS